MTRDYFRRVAEQTGTQVWINNPTLEELRDAIEVGAINGTTNPAYGSKLLQTEAAYMRDVIDGVLAQCDDDERAADEVYQIITTRFMREFLPLFESTHGRMGMVTMQDDPRRDESADWIIDAALRHAKGKPNYMAKIPVTEAGIAAIEKLVGMNIPICGTEVFSISQAIAVCEAYVKASITTGKNPPFYLTHITGIFDEEIQGQVAAQRVEICPDLLKQAGTIVMRKQYRLIKQHGYPVAMLGGGARGIHHFTEWVGGDAHVTINWSTFEELLNNPPPILNRIDAIDSHQAIDELCRKIPDFRRAYDIDGLRPSEFETYAPLLRFRNNFIAGCDAVLDEIAARRNVLASA